MTHFNEIANSWDTSEKMAQNKNYADRMKSALKKSHFNNILEFGCGTGLLGSNFIEDNNHFLGIDTSSGMLDVFKIKFSKFPNVKNLNLNLEDKTPELNDLSTSKFDLIISSMAFHHLLDPLAMLAKFKNYLHPEGAIAIIDLDEENGLFHPDPKKMGVHHFGFSENTTALWAHKLEFNNYSREKINVIKKESGDFPIFLAIYSN